MTAQELYEQVWAEPLGTVAQRFGLSDRGLSGICKRHGIPVPPRGYWARVRAGLTPEQTALPLSEVDRDVPHLRLHHAGVHEASIASEQKRPVTNPPLLNAAAAAPAGSAAPGPREGLLSRRERAAYATALGLASTHAQHGQVTAMLRELDRVAAYMPCGVAQAIEKWSEAVLAGMRAADPLDAAMAAATNEPTG